MLSAGSFSSPYEHLSQPETKRMVEHYTAYLSDNTRLIANPGLKVSAGVGPHVWWPPPRAGGSAGCEPLKWEGQPWICASQLESQKDSVWPPGRLVADDPADGLRSPGSRRNLFQAFVH